MVLKTSDIDLLYVEATVKFNKIDIGILESTGCLVCRRRQLADDTEGGQDLSARNARRAFRQSAEKNRLAAYARQSRGQRVSTSIGRRWLIIYVPRSGSRSAG